MASSDVFSGATAYDSSYTQFYLIDANGVLWKVRISTDGVLSTEQQ